MNRIRANLVIESRFPFVCLFDGLFRVVFFLRPRISNFLNCKKILGKSDGPKWISNFVKKTVLLYNLWWFGYYCLLVSLHREGSAYRAEGLVVAAALQYTTPHFIVLYVYTASLHWTVLHYCAVLTVLYCTVLQYIEMNCTLLIYTAAASLPSGGQLWPLMQREGRRTL